MKDIIGNTNCKRIYILIIEKIERIRNQEEYDCINEMRKVSD